MSKGWRRERGMEVGSWGDREGEKMEKNKTEGKKKRVKKFSWD